MQTADILLISSLPPSVYCSVWALSRIPGLERNEFQVIYVVVTIVIHFNACCYNPACFVQDLYLDAICLDRSGSVYADMEFKYDSSLISITDAIDAVRNATRTGRVYLLPVDDYFMFRGGTEYIPFPFTFYMRFAVVCNMKGVIIMYLFTELKDGMCPVPDKNSSAICTEECQMDSNCTGTQKCCFNGCGHTCQEAGNVEFIK